MRECIIARNACVSDIMRLWSLHAAAENTWHGDFAHHYSAVVCKDQIAVKLPLTEETCLTDFLDFVLDNTYEHSYVLGEDEKKWTIGHSDLMEKYLKYTYVTPVSTSNASLTAFFFFLSCK